MGSKKRDGVDGHAADVGRRLRQTRAALGIEDLQEFGEAAGLEQSLYNRFDNGKRLLTLQAAMKLCERYQLTLDWLYRGIDSGLPRHLSDDLRSHRRPKRES
jgi:transcriptional regulator with XRE-family HTH domain